MAKRRGAEEVLRHRAPEIPDRLDRRVLLALDERLGIDAEQFAQAAQKFRRAMQADRRLQIGPVERLAEQPAEFAVEADIDVRIRQPRHVLDMAAEREDHVDFRADALDEPPDFGEVGGHVEDAVDGPMMLTRGFAPGARGFGLGARPFLGPNSLQSQVIARSALCH